MIPAAILLTLAAFAALVLGARNILPDMTPEQRAAWKRVRAKNEKAKH